MTTLRKGKSAAATTGNHGFSLISSEKLLEIYTSLIKCRMIVERANALLEQRGRGNRISIVGQEAVATGIALALQPKDILVSSRQSILAGFIRGISLKKTIAALSIRSRQVNYNARIDRVIDAALKNKKRKNSQIAVAFGDEKSTPPGFRKDVLRIAGVRQLPILFVCQNNLLTEPLRYNTQASNDETDIHVEARGLPCITVDGNDGIAVYRVATEAIAQARKGNGPTLIACQFGQSKADDPILKMETYLKRKGLFSKKMKIEASAGFAMQLDAAIETDGKSPAPSKIKVDGPEQSKRPPRPPLRKKGQNARPRGE
jgi:TPP-dependent pyruvate/acetoin dehydrogenase alpha subunit